VRRKLARANLDGSDPEILVSEDMFSPMHMAIDVDRQLIYWTDQYSHKVRHR